MLWSDVGRSGVTLAVPPPLPPASLIRGNRANCALFSTNLDWLVSKLDRLEASSGPWGSGGTFVWGWRALYGS